MTTQGRREIRQKIMDACAPLEATLRQMPEGVPIVRDFLRIQSDDGAESTLRSMATALKQLAATCDQMASQCAYLRQNGEDGQP